MKKYINKILSNFNLELHGKNYISKLKSESAGKNPFNFQKEFYEDKKIKPKIIFDVGANVGITVNYYLKIFPDAQIHAFEPTIELKQQLIDTFKNKHNVIIRFEAISDKNDKAIFYKNKVNDTNSLLPSATIGAISDEACRNIGTYEVKTITIDTYCQENNINQIDILKMDIQGAELFALYGAQEMLKNKKIKLIFTELYFKPQYKNQPLFNEVYNFLISNNYSLQDIYNPYFVNNHIAWCDAIFTTND